MNSKVYISTFSEKSLDIIKKYNFNIEFNHTCISENLNEDKIEKTIVEMREAWYQSGAKEGIIHGPFTEIIPASIDKRARDMGFCRLEEAYTVCDRLQVGKMVVHTGYIPQMYHIDWHIEKSADFWKEFMEKKPDNFQIFIENVFEEDPIMLYKLLEKIGDSRVKACLDIGHANVMDKNARGVEDWIETIGKRIGHVHLHNNNGEDDSHGSFEEGDMDILKMIERISNKTDGDFTMTIESSRCESFAKILSKKQL